MTTPHIPPVPNPWPYPRWIAHRGAGKLAPENTLAAFRLGAAHGYRMFECDAKLSADGVVFLMHDATLERTTTGTGIGGDQPWAALAQLDAGSWHSRAHAGEPLPTLANLARFCLANGYHLNIEIKPTPGLEQKTGEVVAREAQQLWQGQAVPQHRAPAAARPAAGHAVDGLAGNRTGAGMRGRGVQPRAVGHLQRDAGPKRGPAHAELHGQ